MKQFFKLFLILIILLTVGCNSRTEKIKWQPLSDSITVKIDSIMNAYKVPGIAVGVSLKGQEIICKGYGFQDLEDSIKVDPYRTLFRIGSVSKPFTAAALAILKEDGKLNFDDPIDKHVQYFPKKRYSITVRQVAGHLGGIRHYRGEEMYSNTFYPSVKEGLSIFIEDTLLFEPRTTYKYSSYGWNLLSAVVEGASGEDFLSFMEREVFDKLGMNTRADINSENIPNRTKFYTRKNNRPVPAPQVDNSYKWAGGGFISTCNDLLVFGNAHLETVLFSEKTLKELIETQYLTDSTATNYGIGWQMGKNYNGIDWYGHSGGSVGGITQLAVYPESGLVVSLVSNSSNTSFKNLHHQIEAWIAEIDESGKN